jgi:hypothetical protein
MAASVMVTPMILLTTELKVSVKACWAPRTSLFRRDTRAPVWVRVKKAMGMRCMWANTLARMSKMRPSPMRADTQRCPNVSPASARARRPTRRANCTMRPVRWKRIPLSMMAR